MQVGLSLTNDLPSNLKNCEGIWNVSHKRLVLISVLSAKSVVNSGSVSFRSQAFDRGSHGFHGCGKAHKERKGSLILAPTERRPPGDLKRSHERLVLTSVSSAKSAVNSGSVSFRSQAFDRGSHGFHASRPPPFLRHDLHRVWRRYPNRQSMARPQRRRRACHARLWPAAPGTQY
jgi:hypothetical protein